MFLGFEFSLTGTNKPLINSFGAGARPYSQEFIAVYLLATGNTNV